MKFKTDRQTDREGEKNRYICIQIRCEQEYFFHVKSLISNYISENNKRNSHHRGEFDLFNLMIMY